MVETSFHLNIEKKNAWKLLDCKKPLILAIPANTCARMKISCCEETCRKEVWQKLDTMDLIRDFELSQPSDLNRMVNLLY